MPQKFKSWPIEFGREILRERGFRPISHPSPEGGDYDRTGKALELWSKRTGERVVLQNHGKDGWDLFLQAAPQSIKTADTEAALDAWLQE